MFLMFSLAYLFFLACVLMRTSIYWVANSFNICLNFKACNWAQFSSDSQNSSSFWKLRSSFIISAKKTFFIARACCLQSMHIYIYINYASQRLCMYSFAVDSYWFQTDENQTKPKYQWFGFWAFDSVWFRTKNRHQTERFGWNPESFRDVDVLNCS